MKRRISYCLVMLLFGIGLSDAGENNNIDRFIQLLSKEASPTLSDYYYFYGRGAEEELQLALNICKKEGWVPTLTHPACTSYIKSREKNTQETPSLYFAWLRKKLPVSPRVAIHKIEHISNKGVLEHELIYASFDDINVVIYKTTNSKDFEQFGRLGISQISGVPIKKIFMEDLEP